MVLRSLYADFEMAAAQVSHADDDNHLAILNAGPTASVPCCILIKTMPLQFQPNAAPEAHPVAKDRNNKPADFKDMGGIGGR